MKDIIVGTKAKITSFVTSEKLALNVGSGEVSVFATPMMAALIENTALKALKDFLDDGETSVGTKIDVSHISATPEGMSIYAVAEIIEVNGKSVLFEVSAYDEKGIIGSGTHERVIVLKDRFNQKAEMKKI